MVFVIQASVTAKIADCSSVALLGISSRGVKLKADPNSRVVKQLNLGFFYAYVQNYRMVN